MASKRVKCRECDWIGHLDEMLEAENPFDPGNGKKFGSKKLHITTEISLKRKMNFHDNECIDEGYCLHEFVESSE